MDQQTINTINRYKREFLTKGYAAKDKSQPIIDERVEYESKIEKNLELIASIPFWKWPGIKARLKNFGLMLLHAGHKTEIAKEFSYIRRLYEDLSKSLVEETEIYDTNSHELIKRQSRKIDHAYSEKNPYEGVYASYELLVNNIYNTIQWIDAAINSINEAEQLKIAELMSEAPKDANGQLQDTSAFHKTVSIAGLFAQDYAASLIPQVRQRVQGVYEQANRINSNFVGLNLHPNAGADMVPSFLATQIFKPGMLKNISNFINFGSMADAKGQLFQVRGNLQQLYAQALVPVNGFQSFERTRKLRITAAKEEIALIKDDRKQDLLNYSNGKSYSLNEMFNIASGMYFGNRSDNYEQMIDRGVKRFLIGMAGAITVGTVTYFHEPLGQTFNKAVAYIENKIDQTSISPLITTSSQSQSQSQNYNQSVTAVPDNHLSETTVTNQSNIIAVPQENELASPEPIVECRMRDGNIYYYPWKNPEAWAEAQARYIDTENSTYPECAKEAFRRINSISEDSISADQAQFDNHESLDVTGEKNDLDGEKAQPPAQQPSQPEMGIN